MGGPGVRRQVLEEDSRPEVPLRRSPACTVVVQRGGLEESRHAVSAVVADDHGQTVGTWGDPDRMTLLRSVAKPFQALPLVEDGVTDRFGITDEELALCCASHNSEDAHIATARSILEKIGLGEGDLACGPHTPLLDGRKADILASGRFLSPIMSNCSGKHAGMLALASFHGWETEGYERPEHPVQRRMLDEIARWTGVPTGVIEMATDGCGVPCFGIPLATLAKAAARFAAAAARGEAPAMVVSAMTGHPFMVAGTDRLCTALMAESRLGLFAKVGAEGVYMAGCPDRGLGVALKVEDGAWRAAPPALLAVLEAADLADEATLEALEAYRAPWVMNTVGDRVGRISVRL